MNARPSLDLWKWSGYWSSSWSQCSFSAQTILCNEQVKEIGSESEYFIYFTIFIYHDHACYWTSYRSCVVPYHLSLLDPKMFWSLAAYLLSILWWISALISFRLHLINIAVKSYIHISTSTTVNTCLMLVTNALSCCHMSYCCFRLTSLIFFTQHAIQFTKY